MGKIYICDNCESWSDNKVKKCGVCGSKNISEENIDTSDFEDDIEEGVEK